MFYPSDVSESRNAYYAMIAILKVVENYNIANPNEPITKILCPGLCTGVGGMEFDETLTTSLLSIANIVPRFEVAEKLLKFVQQGDMI